MARVKNNLSYGKDGLALTEEFEGLRLTAYQDQVGVWTIGYGHTGPEVCAGLTITQADAENLLMRDVAAASTCVNRVVKVQLDQDEFDAPVDFVFNLGASAFAGSTLLRKLNAGDFVGASAEFVKWGHAGGQLVPGLLRRRHAEQQLFLRRRRAEQQLFEKGMQESAPMAAPPVATTGLGMAPALAKTTKTPRAATRPAPVKPAPKKIAPAKPAPQKAAAKKPIPKKKPTAGKPVAKKSAAKKSRGK